MSHLHTLALLVLAFVLPGCGAQVVEFPLDVNAPPVVLSTRPALDAVGVRVDATLTITFNEAMNPATFDGRSVLVSDGTAEIPGSIDLDEATFTASFVPSSPLDAGREYTATVTTRVRDVAGAALAKDYVWSFSTAAAEPTDTLAPTVLVVLPFDQSTHVAVYAEVKAIFSEPMDPDTLASPATTFTVTESTNGTAVAGVVSYLGNTANFTPTLALSTNTEYTATITMDAMDLSGNPLAQDHVWVWTTAGAPDLDLPLIVDTTPDDLDVDVPVTTLVTATFDEAMDPTTVSTTSFTLEGVVSGTVVLGSVSYDVQNRIAIFDPNVDLAPATQYAATVTTGAQDLAGNGLAAEHSWTFTTAVAQAPTVLVTLPLDLSIGVPVNTAVTATFSEVMDSDTLASPMDTFTVAESLSGNPVPGTVITLGNTALFSPSAPLLPDTEYVATITTDATDLSGTSLTQEYVWVWTTAGVADVGLPLVVATTPNDLDLDVPVNTVLTATFDEAMNPSTVSSATFTVEELVSGDAVLGSVSYDVENRVATFDPNLDLEPATQYVATVTTGAQDLAGNGLAAEHSWTFTTAVAQAPTVLVTLPLDLSTGVPVNTAVTATFSEVMDSDTLASPMDTFTVAESLSGDPVPGTVSYLGNSASFIPSAPLLPDTEYVATITTDATDLSGTPLAEEDTWIWTTAGIPDLEPPTITETTPSDLSIEVPVNTVVTAAFSEPMEPETLNELSVTLVETLSGLEVLGTISYDLQNDVMTFVPDSDLLPGTEYTVTVTEMATDLSGNGLVVPALLGLPVPNPWTFETAALIIPPQPLAIDLRGIESFGIASRAGLTSTGITVVNGNVALYPLASCTDSTGNAGASQSCLFHDYQSPTGLTVNGAIFWAGDPFDNGGTANSVTNDLNIAWVEGKNKAETMPPVAGGELGGKVFTPGVYHNATLGLQAGGTATMDAQNDGNAVFIFKIDGSFVDSGTLLLPTRIELINGANARNVWFVAGLDVTIGSGTTWNGTVLAGRTATVLDGSTVTGRVLAGASGAGALTLTGAASPSVTTITVPE